MLQSVEQGATPKEVIRDPVCGMLVDPEPDGPTVETGGHIFHFCHDGCRAKFEADPEQYRTAIDPVCGVDVERATAAHVLKHAGERYHFCSPQC